MLKITVTPIQYLKYFINLPHCLFIFTFHLNYDNSLKRNERKPRLFSLGFIFIWIGVLCRCLVDVSEMYELITKTPSIFNPLEYFTKARQFTNIMYDVLILVFLHQGAEILTEILKLIEDNSERIGNRNILCNPFVSFWWTYAMAFLVFKPVVGVMEFFCSKDKCENPLHSAELYKKTLHLFFIEFSEDPLRYHTLVSINAAGIIVKAIENIFTTTVETVPLLVAGILYFYASLTPYIITDANAISDILEYYNFLKKMASKINSCIGPLILGSTLVSLPYFVDKFLPLIDPTTPWLEYLPLVMYFCNLFLLLYIAVSIRSMASAFEEWISDPLVYAKIPQKQLVVLVMEIQQDKIGLAAGGFGFSIKITNGFFGTMIITWLTFALLILQFKISNTG